MTNADVKRRRDVIMELTAQGLSATDVSRKLGVCLDTVHRTRRERTGAPEPMLAAERQERRERMAERVRDGESIDFVARDEGVSVRTVERACRRA